MILKMHLNLAKAELPKDYSPAFLSLIKNALSTSCKPLFERYYVERSTQEKNFCFAVKFREPVFQKEKIILGEHELVMQLHILNPSDAIDFYNAFMPRKGKSYPFPDANSITITKIEICNHKVITSNDILIKMNSPLLVRCHENGRDTYLSHNHEDFGKYFSLSAALTLKNIAGIETNDRPILIESVYPRKTVVSVFGSKITGNVGIYRLKGDLIALNILMQTGLGSRHSQGFGCFNVIQEVS